MNTKGIRCRLYCLVASYLGYYDPVSRTGDKDNALWYEDKTLCIHSLFESKENVLLFDNVLQDQCITPTSPLDGHAALTNVAPVSWELSELRRIYSRHYVPQDTESPQVTMLSLSISTSIVDVATAEFKYRRIESEEWFGTVGKAQICRLKSREHCRKLPSYHKYDTDQNNRFALTSDLHSWCDGRSFAVLVVDISVESVSEGPAIGSRYKVDLIIRALNAGYASLISLHLKEGFVTSVDGLEMRTSVYVQNSKVFCEWMEWKGKYIDKWLISYYDMAPAVD
ncbi:hypothetical protein PI124_g16870 [Phytophthora idaei]|nr:hypothetical protein PI125_g13612 [Phytophthora idaei]KAG3238154.1 hypothetical protein PI124_g16870 [Phytophthora idaei]